MKQPSLRVRLLKIISIPLVLGLVIIDYISYDNTGHEAEEIYDAQLAHFANILGMITEHEIDRDDFDDEFSEKLINFHNGKYSTSYESYEEELAYRVWHKNKVLFRSESTEKFGDNPKASGYSDAIINEDLWRFFVINEGDVTVEVAEKYDIRSELVEHVVIGIVIPFLFVIPVLILSIWYGVFLLLGL